MLSEVTENKCLETTEETFNDEADPAILLTTDPRENSISSAQTLPDATQSRGKIHPFRKMAVTFEVVEQFLYPFEFILS